MIEKFTDRHSIKQLSIKNEKLVDKNKAYSLAWIGFLKNENPTFGKNPYNYISFELGLKAGS